ncbi:carbohydrate ABC transporter permease, partial [Enterococcus lactis]|nr:carbohydrate ABC transporter permease [Enterococcus lactis]
MTHLLQLKGTIYALILPLAVIQVNILVLRPFFTRSPSDSIVESAWFERAGALLIIVQVVFQEAWRGPPTLQIFDE